jgi:hypothetical protein
MRLFLRWSTWLCLSLMLWTVAVESTHNHPNQTSANSCSICVVAHSTSPTTNVSHRSPVFATVGLLREEEVVAQARLDLSDLEIRGPPAAV